MQYVNMPSTIANRGLRPWAKGFFLASLALLLLVFNLGNTQAQAPDYWPTVDWRTAAPEIHGLNPDSLAAMQAHIEADIPTLTSLTIVRDGYLVYEGYFNGQNRDSLHALWSVTKSFTSALVGIAIDQGKIENVDVPIVTYFPEYIAADDTSGKRDITLRDMLMMRSGLGWVEGLDSILLWRSKRDNLAYILGLEQKYPPGEHWNYSTGESHIVAALVSRATGMSALSYAQAYLFAPLGITDAAWTSDAYGYNIGGAELHLTARDMAKFGFLYLNKGRWEDQQIVPAAWVELTTTPQRDRPLARLAYSMHWWHFQVDDYEIDAAMGYGGQRILLIPELDMIVTITTDATALPLRAELAQDKVDTLLPEYILPAIITP